MTRAVTTFLTSVTFQPLFTGYSPAGRTSFIPNLPKCSEKEKGSSEKEKKEAHNKGAGINKGLSINKRTHSLHGSVIREHKNAEEPKYP